MYKIPKETGEGTKFNTASGFSEYIIRNALISTAPSNNAGKFSRFSVKFETDFIEEELKVIEKMNP